MFTGADGTVLRLTSTVPLRIESADAVGELMLAAGQTATFILEQVAGATRSTPPISTRTSRSPSRPP